jgi:hypothetical protein
VSALLNPDLVLELLPQDGEPISWSVLALRLCERLGRDLKEAEIDGLIWAAFPKVSWDPITRQLKLTRLSEFPDTINQESDLEPWFERFLLREAAKKFFKHPPPNLSFIVQNTARVAGLPGPYSRPDISMAAVSMFHYSPSAQFDLFAFELKMHDGGGAPAVMQTASYNLFAHYTYLGLFLPEGSHGIRNLPTILTRARTHGVGVIQIANPFSDNGYQVLTDASRNSPHPGQTDKFIEESFTEANKSALRKWVRL